MKRWNILFILLFTLFLNSAIAKAEEKQKVVLVLGSGGSRGLAHVGVIEELENLGIVPDVIVGCSSGAIVGALYAQHGDISKVKELLIDLKADDLVDFSLFQKYALSKRTKLENFLEKHLTVKRFSSLKIPLAVVATDLHKGKPVYFRKGKLHPAVLASAALPALFPPYQLEDEVYVDGGVTDPLPVQFAHRLGNVVVIASDISPSLDGFDVDSLPQVVRKAFEVVYQRLAYNAQKEADILLEMDFKDIDSPLNDSANQKLYERGKECVLSQAAEIKKKIKLYT
jgi:NTE family protein